MLNSSLINPLSRKTKDKEMVHVCDYATNIHVLCKISRSKVVYLTISSRLGCPAVSTAEQLLTFRKQQVPSKRRSTPPNGNIWMLKFSLNSIRRENLKTLHPTQLPAKTWFILLLQVNECGMRSGTLLRRHSSAKKWSGKFKRVKQALQMLWLE